MAKPMLVTLPFVFLLMDFWPLGRVDFHGSTSEGNNDTDGPYQRFSPIRLVNEKIPLFAIVIISSIVTFFVQQKEGAVKSLGLFPLTVRIANALVSYVHYMGKMFWPKNLAVLYPHPLAVPLWKSVTACLLLLGISTWVILKRRRQPYLVTGWFWYLGTLVPVIGIVQVGVHGMADRYTYVPLLGLFIMVVWGMHDLARAWLYKRLILVTMVFACIVALVIGTRQQLGHWKDSITLFERAISVTSDNYIAHLNLGAAWYAQGDIDRAIGHYEKALRINANHANIHESLGVALLAKGRHQEAIPHLTRALEIDPESKSARRNLQIALGHMDESADEAESYNRKAIALAAEGKIDAAIKMFKEAIQINPGFYEAHYNLGNVLGRQEKLDEAIHHYSEAVRIHPHYPEAHNNWGIALAKQGNMAEAKKHFSEATKLKPDFAEARQNLKRAESEVGKR
jgi:tetratricopeptide (TPR) repeat protein